MKKTFSKKAMIIVIIAVIIAIITGLSVLLSGSRGFFNNTIDVLSFPLKTAVANVASTCEQLYGYMNDYEKLLEENAELRAEIAGASSDAREMDELESENQRLRSLLGLASRRSDFVFETATITGRTSSNWEATFIINRGSENSNVAVGDAIITEGGILIGIIKTVEPVTSICSSLVDPGFSASVFIENLNEAASATGDYTLMKQNLLRIDYMTDSTLVYRGGTVVTSGKGGVLPNGLLVGYISDVVETNDALSTYAQVEPAVTLDNLSNIFIITDYEISD